MLKLRHYIQSNREEYREICYESNLLKTNLADDRDK